jgi:arylsulfatase A-like enzyme
MLAVLIAAGAANVAVAAPNILLIIADDMGVEALSMYGLAETSPTTASLDALARDGVMFRNFWAQPVCSPTRATIMTGRYGFRTGVGRPIPLVGASSGPLPDPPAKPASAPYEPTRGGMGMAGGMGATNYGVRSTELLFPMALAAGTDDAYRTAAIGKWHIADIDNGWLRHPEHAGIDFYEAVMNGITSYFGWRKVVNGEVVGTTRYAPVDRTDTAIEWLAAQGDEPWFMWLSYTLPHTPLHLPEEQYLQSDYSDLSPTDDFDEQPHRYFHAMIEAMDTEIGRVLASLDPEVRDNTYVIFIGDNGTDAGSIIAPFRSDAAKGTVYEGGVNTPLIVSGPGVERGAVSEALVNSTDLFATMLEMAEVDVNEVVSDDVTHDSISIVPYLANPAMPSRRDWIYADVFPGSFEGIETANYAMRNDRYKLLRHEGTEEFYDLSVDPYEHNNLLHRRMSPEEQLQHDALQIQIRQLRESR